MGQPCLGLCRVASVSNRRDTQVMIAGKHGKERDHQLWVLER